MKIKLTPKRYSYQEAFGSEFPDDQFVMGYEKDHPYISTIDPMYIWDRLLLNDMVIWWEDLTVPMYMFGHTGAGKSAAAYNFCAALGIPMYEKTIYKHMEFFEFVQDKDIIDGDTVNHYGVLPQAMGVSGLPGILVMNEIDRADDGFLTGFYEVLQGRPLVANIGGVDVIKPQKGFRILATGNTSMRGDPNQMYVGARIQDIAFQDRFMKVKVKYPQPVVEEKILEKEAPNLSEKIRKKMVETANDIRAMFMGESDSIGAIPLTMSTRTLVNWAQYTWHYRDCAQAGFTPIYYALDRALLYSTDSEPEIRQAIETVVQGRLGDNTGAN